MKRLLVAVLLIMAARTVGVRAETETIDLKALAKKARPAVLLLVVSDANGKEIATGTGFVVSSDGKLITNFHVIEGAANAVAKAENGGLFPVEGVLASDPKNDLVLLKLKGKELPFLTLGKSENIEVGTRIAVIGSPLGLEGTLSEGIVSSVRELENNQRLLQVTAAISPGSSGSPVLNAKGNVIGVASALLRSGQSLNFAVPIDYVIHLMASVRGESELRSFGTPMPRHSSVSSQRTNDFGKQDVLVVKDEIAALKEAQARVTRDPRDASAYFALGDAYEKLKFYDDAISTYEKALKLKPDNALGWVFLGELYYQVGRTNDGVAAFTRSIQLKPDDGMPLGLTYQLICEYYIRSGHIEDAIGIYRQVVKIKPDDSEAWYNLGVVYGKSGRLDDAIGAYRQTIRIKPDFADAWCGLGVVYCQSGRIDDAIAAHQRAIKIKPDFAEAWHNLGRVYNQSRRIDDEIAAYRRAIKIKPSLAEAWRHLGLAYHQSGQTDNEIAAYLQAIKIKPDFAEAWRNLGVVYCQSGQTDDGIAAYLQAVKIKPDFAEAWSNLGGAYSLSGRSRESDEAFAQARKLKPELFK
jgi:tetratricopeptide (TPR) repeat protein